MSGNRDVSGVCARAGGPDGGGAMMGDRQAPEPVDVLELRVHGVNNTTPAALVDLPPYDLRQVAGDARAGFWLAQPDLPPPPGAHGHIPPGIRREAYSWGGLVRRDAGRARWSTALAASFQVLVLPFSVGNAAMWTRRVTTDHPTQAGATWSAITAGAARVFGLALTLLFTTTAVTFAVDVAALQCAERSLCNGLWLPAWGWVTSVVPPYLVSPGPLLAIATLVPVAAVLVLAWFARRSRAQYDTLLTRPGAIGRAARATVDESRLHGPEAAATTAPPLAQRTFWSNRMTGNLALVHVAAAFALVGAQVSDHVAFGPSAGTAPPVFAWLGILSWCVLAGAIAIAAGMPTETITPRGLSGGPRVRAAAWIAVSTATAVVAAVLVSLWFLTPAAAVTDELYGGDLVPLVIVSGAAAIALSGMWWRRGSREGAAWRGNAPAVFLTLSLALGVLTSAALLGLASLVLVGPDFADALRAQFVGSGESLRVPGVFIAVGGFVAWGIVAFLGVALAALLWRRSLAGRATAWQAPTVRTLHTRVLRARKTAAFIHVMEPASGLLAILGGATIVAGLVLAWGALVDGEVGLGILSGPGWGWAAVYLQWTAWAITIVGVLLAVVVGYVGVLRSKPSFVAIVWDITCFLPRTAQPFGPPCYAERAVPDLAQRLHDWLDESEDHRAVLAAHSMGGMVAVAGIALLGASFPRMVPRVRLLTFGVQLRAFFGRIFPELVGPEVLGTFPSRGPRLWAADPWDDDVAFAGRAWSDAPPPGTPIERLGGRLLPRPGVRWISLWRLTDYLGFPAVSGSPTITRDADSWPNRVDRYADEVDVAAEPAVVVTHNDYIRVGTYGSALRELADAPD